MPTSRAEHSKHYRAEIFTAGRKESSRCIVFCLPSSSPLSHSPEHYIRCWTIDWNTAVCCFQLILCLWSRLLVFCCCGVGVLGVDVGCFFMVIYSMLDYCTGIHTEIQCWTRTTEASIALHSYLNWENCFHGVTLAYDSSSRGSDFCRPVLQNCRLILRHCDFHVCKL